VLAKREWRRLHIEELYAVYFSPDIIRVSESRRMRCVEYVARMLKRRGAYGVLVVKSDVRRPLERPKHRWENNIKMDFQEV
jgi:hypothetical protein